MHFKLLLHTPLKKWIFFSILLLSATFQTHSQEYEKVIVSDINYVRRYSEYVSPEKFPFYFNQKEFVADLQVYIKELISKNFNTDSISFRLLDSIFYTESIIVPPLNIRNQTEKYPDKTTLHLGVETILQSAGMTEGEFVYHFTTRIKGYNHKGKRVIFWKKHIPFVSVQGDEIVSKSVMSRVDFYTFYFDGLDAAFSKVQKKSDLRYIHKPIVEKYESFIQSSEKFYMLTEDNEYAYGKDYNDLIPILKFQLNYWHNNNNTFDFSNLITQNFLDNGYPINNQLDRQGYRVKLKNGLSGWKDKDNPYSTIMWVIQNTQDEHIANLGFDDKDNLAGQYKNQILTLKWVEANNCIEYYLNDKLMALINYFDGEKILFISESATKEELASLVNALFVYDYSLALRKKMHEMP